MSQAFEITKTEGTVIILHFIGNLDSQAEAHLVEAAHEVQTAGGRYLLVDLSKTEMISSAGLRALHSIYKAFTPHEEQVKWEQTHPGAIYKSPHVKLAGASSNIYYVLSISGFLQNLAIYSTLQEALDSFKT